jgi:hypothetical protein
VRILVPVEYTSQHIVSIVEPERNLRDAPYQPISSASLKAVIAANSEGSTNPAHESVSPLINITEAALPEIEGSGTHQDTTHPSPHPVSRSRIAHRRRQRSALGKQVAAIVRDIWSPRGIVDQSDGVFTWLFR